VPSLVGRITSPGKRSAVVTDVANVPLCSEQGTFPTVAGYWALFFTNQEIKMRRLIVVVCCAALAGSVSVASAQTTGPAAQETMKANDPMNANAKKTKKPKKMKKMKKSDFMSSTKIAA
jgi:hypothetical protein